MIDCSPSGTRVIENNTSVACVAARSGDLGKMKNLLGILSDSSKRLPFSTLIKCEKALENFDFRTKGVSTTCQTRASGMRHVLPV